MDNDTSLIQPHADLVEEGSVFAQRQTPLSGWKTLARLNGNKIAQVDPAGELKSCLMDITDDATGEVRSVPYGCGANRCVVCGPRKARETGLAVEFALPTHLITLTGVPESFTWRQVMRAMRDVYSTLRRWGHCVLVAWFVERNPNGSGAHIHGFARGWTAPQAALVEAAVAPGLGSVADVRRITGEFRSGGYAMKAVLNAHGDRASQAAQIEHLTLNGGRWVHGSQGYWLDRRGHPVSYREAIREVRRAARQRAASSTPGQARGNA